MVNLYSYIPLSSGKLSNWTDRQEHADCANQAVLISKRFQVIFGVYSNFGHFYANLNCFLIIFGGKKFAGVYIKAFCTSQIGQLLQVGRASYAAPQRLCSTRQPA